MSNLQVKTRIFGAFIINVILLLVVSFISIRSSRQANDTLKVIKDLNLEITLNFMEFGEQVDEMEVILFRASAARDKKDKSYIENVENNFKKGNDLIQKIKEEVSLLNSKDKEDVLTIMDDLTKDFKEFKERGLVMVNAYIRSGPVVGNMFMKQTKADNEKFSKNMHNAIDSNIHLLHMSLEDVKKTSDNTIRISVIVASVSIIFVIIFGIILSNSISRPITDVVNCTKVMSQGDLTKRLDIDEDKEAKSHNETYKLSLNFNKFANSLCNILSKISNLSLQNSEVKNELLNNTNMIVAAVTQITANIESINKQVDKLDNRIDMSADASDKIESSTATFKDSFNKQIEMEEDSNSAITQMAASITNVASITNDKKRVIEKLNKTAQDGNNRLQSTLQVINDIADSVEKINEMVALIGGISSQTNLLSMNASIEAAHAGEVGKGFAVVADEIGKLADSSRDSLDTISNTINSVTESIKMAVESGNETDSAFKEINSGIYEVTIALEEISSSTEELNIGSNMILDSIGKLQELSSVVKDESVEMIKNSETVTSSMDTVKEISHQVTSSISEIRIGIKDISDSMLGLEELSDNIGHITDDLNQEVSKFKTQ